LFSFSIDIIKMGQVQSCNELSDEMSKASGEVAVAGFVVQNKRSDGSTVKELYIPKWNVAFFYSSSSISVRKQEEVLEGTPIHITSEHAAILRNLLLKSEDYLDAGKAAKDAFSTYLGDSDQKN